MAQENDGGQSGGGERDCSRREEEVIKRHYTDEGNSG
jgi:hypothetical protein